LSRLPLPADNSLEYAQNSKPKDYNTHTFDNMSSNNNCRWYSAVEEPVYGL